MKAKRAVKPVTVAILDWGVQPDHREFGYGVIVGAERAIAPGNGDVFDDSTEGHGTMLAGIIGGAAPEVGLLVVKFIDTRTTPSAANAAAAIRCALRHPSAPQVINASWDVSLDEGSLADAIAEARDAGVVVVAGAGNDGRDNDSIASLPATYTEFDNLISVMACNEADRKPEFSNYGKQKVHLAAPGTRIISTTTYHRPAPSAAPGSPYSPGYLLFDGTSASAAFVTAAAAMLKSAQPGWSPRQIRDRLITSAAPCRHLAGLCQANGRLDLSQAVLLL
jgi:subtilisin family serine protease